MKNYAAKLIGNQNHEDVEFFETIEEAQEFADSMNSDFQKEYKSLEAYYDDINSQEYVVMTLEEFKKL